MEAVAVSLWSINERLGGRDGMDVPPLAPAWYSDVIQIAVDESEAIREQIEDAEDEMLRSQAKHQYD